VLPHGQGVEVHSHVTTCEDPLADSACACEEDASNPPPSITKVTISAATHQGRPPRTEKDISRSVRLF
jgi:hypothetical protein